MAHRRPEHSGGALNHASRFRVLGWGLTARSPQPAGTRHPSSGFTLTEVMVASLLSLLLGWVMLVLSFAGNQMRVRMDAQLTTLTEAQRALNRVSEDLRQARQSGLACGPGSTLAFTSVIGPAVTYQLNGNTLVKREGGGGPQVIASGVTAFTPTCAAGGQAVQVSLTARANQWYAPLTLSSQVWVRNP